MFKIVMYMNTQNGELKSGYDITEEADVVLSTYLGPSHTF